MLAIKLSHCREVRDLIGDDWREAVENMRDGTPDFESGGYRFIHDDEIAGVLESELTSDEYVLGCFNANLIADCTGWPLVLISAAQKGEAYEALGKAIIQEGHAAKMAELYARYDGYGHHFGTYDGNEDEIGAYHVFRRD